MPATKPPTHHLEDDELDELPPIDGDGIDDEEDAGTEELDEEPDDGGDPLDDSTGEGDPVDEEVDESGAETGWLDDAGDSDGLDVGTPDTFGAEEESSSLLEGAEGVGEAVAGEDDLPFADAEGASVVGDSGEEGFDEEDEAVREEDLPRLDSGQDDSADADDADLLESLPEEDVTEEPRPPWDDRAWERVDGEPAGVAPVDALASGPDGIVLGGQGLGRIERLGQGWGPVTALEAVGFRGGALSSLAIDGGSLLAASSRAGLFVSEDGGKSFQEKNGWRALVVAREAEGPIDVVLVGTDLWGRCARGSLVWSGDRGTTWTSVLPELRFDAVAADQKAGHAVAIARGDGTTLVARGASGRMDTTTVGALPEGKLLGLAASDGRLAVAMARGALRLESEAWARLEGTAGLTAMTFARGDGTLLIALHAEGEEKAWMLEARAGAPALTVAEVGEGPTSSASESAEGNEDGDDARVRALCWDAVEGVVWAGGAFGLKALRPARH